MLARGKAGVLSHPAGTLPAGFSSHRGPPVAAGVSPVDSSVYLRTHLSKLLRQMAGVLLRLGAGGGF